MGFFGKIMGGKMLGICEAEQTLCQAQCCSGVSMGAEEKGRLSRRRGDTEGLKI